MVEENYYRKYKMLININKSLNFKDELNIIISLGIDTLKIQIEQDQDKELDQIIKTTMEEYIVITKEENTKSHIIYDNSIINPENNNGTSIGRVQGDIITLYGLNQITPYESQLKILQNLFKNYIYIIIQPDLDIDIFGLAKNRISSVYDTSTARFSPSPREQLKSDYIHLSGIGTTHIIIPDDKKHRPLLSQIKRQIKLDNSQIKAVIQVHHPVHQSCYKKYYEKSNKVTAIGKIINNIKSKDGSVKKKERSSFIHFKIQEEKHLNKINTLIKKGSYKIDYNPLAENGNDRYIAYKSSKRSLLKHYNKFNRYLSKGYDEDFINEHIENIVTEFKNQYITDEDEYDKFEIQYMNKWMRIEHVIKFDKSDELTFEPTQIKYLAQKIYQKTNRLKTRIFNIGQRGNKSRLDEYIKLNNKKAPKELYNLEAVKNNFYEYQPSVEDIYQTLKDFIEKINSL